ncbi:STAS domain-containing protein [Dactylosporangium roseum]|uniref:STAS domain-containing protein n=1 Tax=Dactylosporangium roseum TaxID=47989 RepID=A0ABY5YWM3_9ACTN|nr:STAS domain-containing protein [Dactylosporangium roseum]UWZ33781.1 STAS domain-containing protein [Dactylosporangium roseum]
MRSDTVRPAAPTVEIIVTEELDAASVPRMSALLQDAMAMRPGRLLVDLAQCPFVDASAIGMLLDVHRQMWSEGGRLTLRGPSPRVRRTLHLARVDHVLHVE